MSKTYLLTGGTGFLGSLLSIELIGRGDKVIFLGRSKDGKVFKERIKEVLRSIEPDISFEQVGIFEVNLLEESLGLPKDIVAQLLNEVDGIWHLAANLSFRERDREAVFTDNVDILKNILSFSEEIKSPVYYTSTAYVHGQRPGVVFEDELIKPNKFNNPYEESKFEAEKVIRKWGERGNQFIIFRPSILIETGRKTLSFFGYYSVVYSLYRLRQKLKDGPTKIFIPYFYSRTAFLNLMPINIAIRWMLKIIPNPKALNRTFHITNPLPFSMKDVTEQTFGALEIKIPTIRSPRWMVRLYFCLIKSISVLLKSFRGLAKRFYHYKYYMIEYNIYDMKNTKELLGQDIVNQFNFPSDFLQNIAKDFIARLKQKNEKT